MRPVNSTRSRSAKEPKAPNSPTWGSENNPWARAKTDGITTAARTERLTTRSSGSFDCSHRVTRERVEVPAGAGGAAASVMSPHASCRRPESVLRRQRTSGAGAEADPLGQLAFEVDTVGGTARSPRSPRRRRPEPLGEVLVVDHARKRRQQAKPVVGLLVATPGSPRHCRPKPSPVEARQRRGRYSSSARSSRQRWASLRSLVRKPSIRASLALICCARDSLSTSASSRVAFCAACAFLVVAPLVAR